MKKIGIVSVVILLFSSSVNGQNRVERKLVREEESRKEYVQIKKLIESNQYTFQVDHVNPVGFGSINVSGNSYTLRISKDSVNIYLPYFGVRHSGGGFGDNDGIEVNGLLEDYNVEYDDDKKRITIKFIGRNKGERFDMTLYIKKSGNSSLFINSIKRSTINYSGKLIENTKIDEISS